MDLIKDQKVRNGKVFFISRNAKLRVELTYLVNYQEYCH